ncbi:hypothetical protein A9G35_05345 [Gilliamella sp. Choc5-1]|jgi:hypothetical protein|uniref:enhanced serine sensitivity protein SseB n=1 Tax=Gilliamella sp. Choc5-1 TaxID=3120238 RepID=UPI00080E48A3|nr:enhanced serine sensitivity protein SseB [Gilliamella apicola]OCG46465.1 hypothetical protein A9G35_05345 [Gilliamella apicola]
MSFDVSQPVTNPKLIEALQTFNQTPSLETKKNLFDHLKSAKLLAPITMNLPDNIGCNDDNTITLQQGNTLSFVAISNVENKNFFPALPALPAFTDWNELRKWQNIKDQQTLVVDLSYYQTLLNDSDGCKGVVINPFGNSFQLDRSMLSEVLTDNSPSTENGKEIYLSKDTEVIIGTPEQYPHILVGKLKEHLQNKSEVNAAYLRLMVQNQQQSYLVVVDIQKGVDTKAIFNDLGQAAQAFLAKDMFIDFIVVDTEFGQQAIKDEKPFYQKKRKGFFNRLFGK